MLALLDHARAACPEAPACYLRGYLVRASSERHEPTMTAAEAAARLDEIQARRRPDPRADGAVAVGRVDLIHTPKEESSQ
jgi:hypothetical protein